MISFVGKNLALLAISKRLVPCFYYSFIVCLTASALWKLRKDAREDQRFFDKMDQNQVDHEREMQELRAKIKLQQLQQ